MGQHMQPSKDAFEMCFDVNLRKRNKPEFDRIRRYQDCANTTIYLFWQLQPSLQLSPPLCANMSKPSVCFGGVLPKLPKGSSSKGLGPALTNMQMEYKQGGGMQRKGKHRPDKTAKKSRFLFIRTIGLQVHTVATPASAQI